MAVVGSSPSRRAPREGGDGGPDVGRVVATLAQLYDPRWAESWDAVGLVCGDPASPVRKILFAVDPVAEVVDEALDWGADLVIAHHPLLLRPVHGVSAGTAKGKLIHRLVQGGSALLVAHTNADTAAPGVSDALARVLGLDDLVPLAAAPGDPLDKVVTFVPDDQVEAVVDAMAAAGAGALGEYSRCAWTSAGSGTFVPGVRSSPTVGRRGQRAEVSETRVEMVAPRRRRDAVVGAVRRAHPYEHPAIDVLELASWSGPRGIGRVGVLPSPQSLEDFATTVAAALPPTAQGVRVAGDRSAPVQRVAVCGGAGDGMFDAVRASGADVYVTADLRHHPASEAREQAAAGTPFLIDVAHWASEWPWLSGGAERLAAALGPSGARVEIRVSTISTDPWTFRLPSTAGVPR